MKVPQRGDPGKAIKVHGNRFAFYRIGTRVDESGYNFMLELASKQHCAPGQQRGAEAPEHKVEGEGDRERDDQERKRFTRAIGDNAVINLEADKRQSQREEIEHQGRQVDCAGDPRLSDGRASVRTSR